MKLLSMRGHNLASKICPMLVVQLKRYANSEGPRKITELWAAWP